MNELSVSPGTRPEWYGQCWHQTRPDPHGALEELRNEMFEMFIATPAVLVQICIFD